MSLPLTLILERFTPFLTEHPPCQVQDKPILRLFSMTGSPNRSLRLESENAFFVERQEMYQAKRNWLAELLQSSDF